MAWLSRLVMCGACVLMLSLVCRAGPRIKVNKSVYDAGTILEGSKDKLRYTFVLTNTGDEPLKIEQVKPG